jgi:hypothetical protein
MSRARRASLTSGSCLWLFSAGCSTYNPHVAATPTPRGATDLTITADALVVDRGLGPELMMAPDVSLRRGLRDDWDVGARLFPAGIELNARHRLVDRGPFELSLMPLLTGGVVTYTNADTSFVATSAGLAALNDVRLGKSTELTLGLRSGLELGLNAVAVYEDFSAARWRVVGGGSVALTYHVSAVWSLSFGVVVLVPYDLDQSETGFPIIQGGAAASF